MGIELVFFISIINGLFSYNLFEAAPINGSTPIVNLIADDSNACANKSVIYQSKYLQQACNISLPDATSDIKNNVNINQYLCTALYDQSVKVCSLQTATKKDLFTNQASFDEEINKIITHSKQVYLICNSIELNDSLTEYNVTKPFVNKLKNYLQLPKICVDKCLDETSKNNSSINPLCAILYYVNEKIKTIQSNDEKKAENNDAVGKPKVTETDNTTKSKNPGISKEVTPTKPDQNLKIQTAEEKMTNLHGKTDSVASTSKNDGTKPNSENQDGKTTEPVNEQINKVVDPPPLAKNTENGNTGEEKPGTIDDPPIINPDDSIQHFGDDSLPEEHNLLPEDNDLSQMDGEDKMNEQEKPSEKPDDQTDSLLNPQSIEKDDDVHFFGYFTILGLLGIGSCLAYHHKQKILAILLEGRRSRGGRGRRRPSTASYRKLDCTLEEAVTSQCNANVTHVIY